MSDSFLEKLGTKDYISKALFENISITNKETIPKGFDLDRYNEQVISEKYRKYYDYFTKMYQDVDDSIRLDEEQIKAILADEDYSLIIAGAGTGKTTTMVSKVKYLVEVKKIDPSQIIVMSYTKKACEELEKRLVIDFEIPVKVTTFHSLGLLYIREIFKDRKCYVVDDNLKEEIFYHYFTEEVFPYKDKVAELISSFNVFRNSTQFFFGKHFRENYQKYDSFDEYFNAYKEMKKMTTENLEEAVDFKIEKMINREDPLTIQNELVKSKGEAIIANFLYCNHIEYRYEKVYKELMEDKSVYRPDFTLDLLGEEVYIEYFGLSNYRNEEIPRYEKIRRMKEEYHEKNHTKFIKIDYKKGEDLIKELEVGLLNLGFKLVPRTTEEIFDRLLENNKTAQIFSYKKFLFKMINYIKSSPKRKNYFEVVEEYIRSLPVDQQEEAKIQFKYIQDFYIYYQKCLYGAEDYRFDFSDLIYYANEYLDKIENPFSFQYLIIDEYQDISEERYRFVKNIVQKNHAKIVAVGDDWQSIYAFAGSKIKYIYDFEKYFPNAKLLKITKTYRNSQDLIDYSGSFIMKNKDQIAKELVSSKNIEYPIKFVFFEENEEYDKLKALIQYIHVKNKDHHILILARTKKDIARCYQEPELRDGIDTKIDYIGYEDIDIDGMTMHKAKGLSSDEVILIGLDQYFPSEYENDFWLSHLFKPEGVKENIAFAEERRLFYVALTRTKNYVYLLVNKNPRLRSPFINEIYHTIEEVTLYKNE